SCQSIAAFCLPPTAYFLKLRFLNDLNNTPAFSSRHRTCLYDPHLVADLGTFLVMGHEFLSLANVLAIDRVLYQAVNANDYGHHHLVRCNDADLLGPLALLRLAPFTIPRSGERRVGRE